MCSTVGTIRAVEDNQVQTTLDDEGFETCENFQIHAFRQVDSSLPLKGRFGGVPRKKLQTNENRRRLNDG